MCCPNCVVYFNAPVTKTGSALSFDVIYFFGEGGGHRGTKDASRCGWLHYLGPPAKIPCVTLPTQSESNFHLCKKIFISLYVPILIYVESVGIRDAFNAKVSIREKIAVTGYALIDVASTNILADIANFLAVIANVRFCCESYLLLNRLCTLCSPC